MEHNWYYMEIKWSGRFGKEFIKKCGSLSEETREKEYKKMIQWFKKNHNLKLLSVEFYNGIATTTK